MKKLKYILLIIIGGLTSSLNAQTISTSDHKELQKKKYAETLLSMIESAKPYYSEGSTYKDFKQELYGTSKIAAISKEGEAIIKKVYYYLEANASNKIILNDSGEVIAEAIILTNTARKQNKNVDKELFGDSISNETNKYRDNHLCGCCFFCFGCHIRCIEDLLGL